MAGGGRIGGQGNLIQRGIWIFIACCIVVAVWNTFPHDPRGFYQELNRKSESLKGIASGVAGWIEQAIDSQPTKEQPNHQPAKHQPTN